MPGFSDARRIKSFRTDTSNSLSKWYRIKNPFRVVFNFIIIYFCKYCPFLGLKRVLLRLTGMRVGRNASIGLAVTFDIFFPELIEVGDNCVIGYNTTVIAHEFLIDEYRTGNVVIGDNVMIGANSTVLAGTEIGAGSVVSAMSLVNKNVRPNSFAGGVPFRYLKKSI